MSARTAASLTVWRSRHPAAGRNRAYMIYLVFMITLITAAPVVRVIWVTVTSPEGIALLTSAASPGAAGMITATLWAGALVVGRERGPALLPPFLTHALATSAVPKTGAIRGPVLRAGTVVSATTGVIAGVVGGGLAHAGITGLASVIVLAAAGALVGVLATIAWLAGQALPRAAAPSALVIIAIGVISAAVPQVLPFTPWGWFGLAFPVPGIPLTLVALGALTALTALAAAAIAAAPMLLNRLGTMELTAQAVRWGRASTNLTGFDVAAASQTYRAQPRRGRRLRAVRTTGRLPLTFLVRDAIGAVRTPGRLLVGALALGSAGVLIAFAFTSFLLGWALGAAAGVIAVAGLGPFTDGLRHAASVASEFPLYGVSDAYLVASHALWPLTVIVVLVLVVVTVSSVPFGIAPGAPAVASLVIGALSVMIRIADALQGPLPTPLFVPIPTDMGDLGAARRLVWAFDAPIFAALAGASAALVYEAPLFLPGVVVALLFVGGSRWRRRA